jgi:hypothetical protein
MIDIIKNHDTMEVYSQIEMNRDWPIYIDMTWIVIFS